jgi:hypothetical protein
VKWLRTRRERGKCQDHLKAVLGVLPEVPHGLHATHRTATLTYAVLGQSPIVPAAIAAVHLHPFYTATTAGDNQATTATYTRRIPVLQLPEVQSLCQGLPLTVVNQPRGQQSAWHCGLAASPTPLWRRCPWARKYL